jgi:hypothetical protein
MINLTLDSRSSPGYLNVRESNILGALSLVNPLERSQFIFVGNSSRHYKHPEKGRHPVLVDNFQPLKPKYRAYILIHFPTRSFSSLPNYKLQIIAHLRDGLYSFVSTIPCVLQ